MPLFHFGWTSICIPICKILQCVDYISRYFWGKKNREDLSCFYLFICGTLYIDWKSHLLWIKRTLYIITQRNRPTHRNFCAWNLTEIERQKEKVCNQFLLSIFLWKIQCDRWRWLHRVWKQKQLSPWVSQWTL